MIQGGNSRMLDAELSNLYNQAYSNQTLDGILGDSRTLNGAVNLGENLTPSQVFEKSLEWGKKK